MDNCAIIMVPYRSRSVRTRRTKIIVDRSFFGSVCTLCAYAKIVSTPEFVEFFKSGFCTIIFFLWFYFVP